MGALLEIESLSTVVTLADGSSFNAVDGVSLAIEAGETVGLVGESGSGKTMTALSVLRLLPSAARIASGRILFAGRDLAALDDGELRRFRGSEIGVIFQDPLASLNPTMLIGRQVAEAVSLHRRVSRKAAVARAVEVLRLVGLPEAERRVAAYPHQLSGGMRQRVTMAIALANEPKLLIADEPTTSLDVTIQRQFLDLIGELKARLDMAVLLVTHDLAVIAGRADRVVVMYAGKFVETADAATLFARPRHPYTRALLDSRPERAAASGGRLYAIPGMPPDMRKPLVGCRFAPRCPKATIECRTSEPPLVSDGLGRAFACFHPEPIPERGYVFIRRQIPERERVHKESTQQAEDAEDGRGRSVAPRSPGPDRAEFETDAQPLLRVCRLTKEFPVTRGAVLQQRVGSVSAVADVSFDLKVGETLGLVGESGCGKSTIGRLLVGLEHPSTGEIVYEGNPLQQLKGPNLQQFRREVQVMFQDPYSSLDPMSRVASSLEEPLVVHRIGDRNARRRRVSQLVDVVGLPSDAVDRKPYELSGGQRQRVGLARALALQPRLLVADEPLSSLDVSIQAQILNLMRDLQREYGLAYLFISHDLSAVKYVSNRIAVMYLGKLVELGPRDAVYDRPAHPYTRGLLDASPVVDPPLERGKPTQGIRGELPSAFNPPSGCRFRTRCPRAQEICAEKEPLFQEFDGGHVAACHFPLEMPRKTVQVS